MRQTVPKHRRRQLWRNQLYKYVSGRRDGPEIHGSGADCGQSRATMGRQFQGLLRLNNRKDFVDFWSAKQRHSQEHWERGYKDLVGHQTRAAALFPRDLRSNRTTVATVWLELPIKPFLWSAVLISATNSFNKFNSFSLLIELLLIFVLVNKITNEKNEWIMESVVQWIGSIGYAYWQTHQLWRYDNQALHWGFHRRAQFQMSSIGSDHLKSKNWLKILNAFRLRAQNPLKIWELNPIKSDRICIDPNPELMVRFDCLTSHRV